MYMSDLGLVSENSVDCNSKSKHSLLQYRRITAMCKVVAIATVAS